MSAGAFWLGDPQSSSFQSSKGHLALENLGVAPGIGNLHTHTYVTIYNNIIYHNIISYARVDANLNIVGHAKVTDSTGEPMKQRYQRPTLRTSKRTVFPSASGTVR